MASAMAGELTTMLTELSIQADGKMMSVWIKTKRNGNCRSFCILLDAGQFLQNGSQVSLLPGTVSYAKVAKLSSGCIDGLT